MCITPSGAQPYDSGSYAKIVTRDASPAAGAAAACVPNMRRAWQVRMGLVGTFSTSFPQGWVHASNVLPARSLAAALRQRFVDSALLCALLPHPYPHFVGMVKHLHHSRPCSSLIARKARRRSSPRAKQRTGALRLPPPCACAPPRRLTVPRMRPRSPTGFPQHGITWPWATTLTSLPTSLTVAACCLHSTPPSGYIHVSCVMAMTDIVAPGG